MNFKELRLYGIKSHDCHGFMQTLIPIAYRDLFSKGIWDVLTKISYFFSNVYLNKLHSQHIEQHLNEHH
jgi:hypothetical protein